MNNLTYKIVGFILLLFGIGLIIWSSVGLTNIDKNPIVSIIIPTLGFYIIFGLIVIIFGIFYLLFGFKKATINKISNWSLVFLIFSIIIFVIYFIFALLFNSELFYNLLFYILPISYLCGLISFILVIIGFIKGRKLLKLQTQNPPQT